MFHLLTMIFGARHLQLFRNEIFHDELDILRRISSFVFWLWAILLAHSFAMMAFEGLNFFDALWLSVTTITTVGYGDFSAQTPMGRVSTVVLIYICGIFLLAQVASDYVDYRIARRERIQHGKWDWHMRNHILILNAPVYNAEIYFRRIVSQIREHADYRNTPIQILTTEFKEGLPNSLAELGVRHYRGSPNNFDDLMHVNVNNAMHILVLAKNEYDRSVDSVTFDVVHRLSELNVVDHAYVECVDDDNRERLFKLGARVVLRPIRSYPEIVVRAMVAPGSEAIIEDFFTHEGDHPIRYEVDIEQLAWHEIVSAIARADYGTAMGYIDSSDRHVVPNPPANTIVTTEAIIVLVREDFVPNQAQVEACLASV